MTVMFRKQTDIFFINNHVNCLSFYESPVGEVPLISATGRVVLLQRNSLLDSGKQITVRVPFPASVLYFMVLMVSFVSTGLGRGVQIRGQPLVWIFL